MSYGSAADEERTLAYAETKQMPAASASKSRPTAAVSDVQLNHVGESSPTFSVTTDRLVNYARNIWRECRPWNEFYSTRALSMPQFAALSERVAKNLHVYRANYMVIVAFYCAIMLLRSIPSVIVAALLYLAVERWSARRNGLSPRDKILVAFMVLLVIWLTDIGNYVITSLMLSSISVALHATFHETDVVETEIATV
ncbi:PRA1 protein [Gracilaria domingensis]|nr:PRA1 protein [Gracilaria domingensis]